MRAGYLLGLALLLEDGGHVGRFLLAPLPQLLLRLLGEPLGPLAQVRQQVLHVAADRAEELLLHALGHAVEAE